MIQISVKLFNPFDSIVLPRIKKSVQSTIAADIIETQPMSAPTGLLFHLDFDSIVVPRKRCIQKIIINLTNG